MAPPDPQLHATPADETALLSAQSVTFERFGEPVFAPVSLDLAPGRTVYLRGANGSGKTTLLRILAGLLQPASGYVRRMTALHYLGHRSALKADLSVLENLTHHQRFSGQARDDEVLMQAITRLQLGPAAHQRVGRLSAGQKRRTALARLALNLEIPVWLLDEPASNLDAPGIEQLHSLLAEHASLGGAQIICTHQTPAAAVDDSSEIRMRPGSEHGAAS